MKNESQYVSDFVTEHLNNIILQILNNNPLKFKKNIETFINKSYEKYRIATNRIYEKTGSEKRWGCSTELKKQEKQNG